MSAQPHLAWKTFSEAEKYVWACAFATSDTPVASDRARYADSVVYLFRHLPDHESLVPARPETEAAYANASISRTDFDIWYRIQLQIRFGNRWDYKIPSDKECAEAYERYQMGLDSYM